MLSCLVLDNSYSSYNLKPMKGEFFPKDTSFKHHLFYDEPRPFANCLLEISKIFDGFFLCNFHAAKQAEFLENNKIGLIVNCAPQQVHLPLNHRISIFDYDFFVKRQLRQKLNTPVLMDLIAKIDYCHQIKCETVAVVAKRIDSRCIVLAVAFIMIKYKWNLEDCLQLMLKKVEVSLNTHYLSLLEQFSKKGDRSKSTAIFQSQHHSQEQLLLRNTFLNSHMYNLPNFHGLSFQKEDQMQQQQDVTKKIKKVKFIDNQEQILTKGQAVAFGHSSPLVKQQNKVQHKIRPLQNRLKKFIRQKCSDNHHSDSISLKDILENQCIEIKREICNESACIENNEIVPKQSRKRALSKTEQSQESTLKDETKISYSLKKNNFMSLQMSDECKQKDQNGLNNLNIHINLVSLRQNNLQANKKSFYEKSVVQNKKYRILKRFYTQQSTEIAKDQSSNIPFFKINQSNKNSYQKIRTSCSPSKQINSFTNSGGRLNLIRFQQIGISNEDVDAKLSRRNFLRQNYTQKNIINVNLKVHIKNVPLFKPQNNKMFEDHNSSFNCIVIKKSKSKQNKVIDKNSHY